MHRNFLLSIVCLFFISSSNGQLFFYPQPNRPALLWQKCLGGTAEDVAKAAVLTPDGGVIVAGDSKSNDGDVTGHHGTTAFTDGWVVKLSAARQIEWQVSLGGSENDIIKNIIQTSDGGYLCIGSTRSVDGDIAQNRGGTDVWLVKLSASGAVSWSKTYGGSGTDDGVAVIQLSGSGINYIVSATSGSRDGDVAAADTLHDTNAWFFKLNENGEILWQKSIDQGGDYANRDNVAIGIAETQGGELIGGITGYGKQDTMFVDLNYYTESYDTTRFSYNIHPCILYKINADNGEATYFTQTKAKYDYTIMSFSGNDLYLAYTASGIEYFVCDGPAPYNMPIYLDNDMLVVSKVDLTTGALANSYMAFNYPACPQGENSPERVYFGFNGNSLNAMPGETWVMGGIHSTESRGGTFSHDGKIISNSFSGNYGGIFYDGFNVIKPLPDGNDFICAGYTNSTEVDDGGGSDVSGLHGAPVNGYGNYPYDFWVTKISLNANRLFGKVFLDLDNNNQPDSAEPVYRRALVTIKKYGAESMHSIGENGYYESIADTGTYTVQLHLYDSVHYTAAVQTVNFATRNDTAAVNIAVHQVGSVTDYAATLSSPNTARPGFPVTYTITCSNNGTDTFTNKEIIFVKDSRLAVNQVNPAAETISGDTLKWQTVNILPGDTRHLSVNMTVSAPPAVNISDTLTSYVLIDSTGDSLTADNYSILKQEVRGAMDPNDKMESHGGAVTRLEVKNGNYLTYTIRFQNTGNDTAFNVVIRDSLDAGLVQGDFEMVASSHPYNFKMEKGRFVTWTLPGINLEDSFHNEPGSHGYITYRIKPKHTLAVGDEIKNNAAIYFDFNPPVVTNTTITAVTRSKAIWTGAADSEWANRNNWNIKEVPDEETAVIIPADVPQFPVVNSNAVCYSLHVQAAASVTISTGFTIEVTGK